MTAANKSSILEIVEKDSGMMSGRQPYIDVSHKGGNEMRVPYAIQDFKSIRDDNLLYVDKTKYLEILENTERYVLFLRPRRFGKTLFTSVLEYYYDIRYKDAFAKLFGGLYIGANKTAGANNYNVLKFNFSGILTAPLKVERSFVSAVKAHLREFINLHHLNIVLNEMSDESSIIIRDFLADYKYTTNRKIYLIIDEYDHFANNVLSEDRAHFNHITSRDGFVRIFYEVFKMYAGNIIDRIFITGVTPITLDSLTSGFNISKNCGNRKALNEMIGFTEMEVTYLLNECGIDETYIDILREHYNGYLFNNQAKNKVYNSNMVMYFLSEFISENEFPQRLVDENIISDYSKITKLFELYEDEKDKQKVIEDIVGRNGLSGEIKSKIGPLIKRYSTIEEKNQLGFTRNDFISLLYYLGLLTISGVEKGSVNLFVPNYCISNIYTEYYLSYLYRQMNSEYTMEQEIKSAMRNVIGNNNFTQYKEVVEKLLKGIANKDYEGFDEKYVKLMMYSVARYSNIYLVKTEYEVEKGRRADLVMLPNHMAAADYYYIFEIKYMKKDGCTAKKVESMRQKAREQVIAYASSVDLKGIVNLRKYVVIAVKDELRIFEEIVD